MRQPPPAPEIIVRHEITIPKSRLDVTLRFTLTTIVVFFALLGVVNICHRTALVSSSLWLALITLIIRSGSARDGGFRRFLTNRLGDLVGRRYAASAAPDVQPRQIRFGYQLLGRRFLQQTMAVDTIASVAWNTGQATGMAGRDMNDWQVALRVDRPEPDKNGQKLSTYLVGPSTDKDRAEALGLSLVALLREAGANLTPDAIPTRFVRASTEQT